MIAKFKKTSRTQWAGAMLILAVLACVVLTNAYVAKADFHFGTPTNLGPTVNSSRGDWPPSISADGLTLYFGSYDRPGGYGTWDLWVATRETADAEWGIPANLGPTVNSFTKESGPSISTDGLSLFFHSDRRGGVGPYGTVDIWVTTRATTGDPWGEPVNLGPTVNSSDREAVPSISADGLSLFFVSDRPGGFGETDLYVATRDTIDGEWSTPANLGPTVNTLYADAGPNISGDGLSFFFHSSRPGGSGRNDIWVTRRTTTGDPWAEPVNLGSTVNSSDRDVTPFISADGSTLFFTSDRPGGEGDWDLWQAPVIPIVDFNGDGIVDAADMSIMIDHWGTDESLCDIGPMPWGDGIVDVQDLIVLAEHLTKEAGDPNLVGP